jgi:hypothetical protein
LSVIVCSKISLLIRCITYIHSRWRIIVQMKR